MRILLTGASGFIGRHVADALARRGGEVVGYCRRQPPSDTALIDWVCGDVVDGAALTRALSRCEAAVHVAAVYSYARADAAQMQAVNVEGTRTVLRASVAASIGRVLITSSSATCGPVRGRPATEHDAPPAWELRIPYKRTKLIAERLALSAAGAGTEVLCVNPTTVVGPGDEKPTPSGRMLRDLVDGRINGYIIDAGINVVSVYDVADGHALALDRGRSGHRYILAGENLPLREAFEIVLGNVGRHRPLWPVPWRAAYALALATDAVGRISGREPRLIVRDEVLLSRVPMYFSSAKAERELGYASVPAAVALGDAVRWLARVREPDALAPGSN